MRFGCLVVSVALTVSGCREPSPYFGVTRPQHGSDEIWTNLVSEPETIDPGKASDSAAGEIIQNLFTGLVEPHPVSLKPMPALATHWDVHDKGRRYVFHLRPSTWSDGRPLEASDFEYAWTRLLDPRTASKYGGFLHPIEFGEAFNLSAVVISGWPDAQDAPDVASLLGQRRSLVERVQWNPRTATVTAYVAGEGAQAADNRRAVISALDGVVVGQGTLRAKIADASMVGVRALDAQTLEVRIDHPIPYFLDLLCFYVTVPVPRHIIEPLEQTVAGADRWTLPEHLVSNGPYVVREWRFRQRVVLERNPRYWDAAHVRTPRIRFVMVDSYNTALNLYQAGELDYIGANSQLPAEFVDHLSRFRDFHRDPYLSVYLFWINSRQPPLDDVRVRRALSLAVDRSALVKYVTRAGQVPTATLVPDGLRGYRSPRFPLFDPEQARRILVAAGYGPEHPLPSITLSYNTSEGHKQVAEAVQQMWREHLGINVVIESQEWKVYLKNLQQMQFQVARLGWVGDYADPYTFLELLRRDNGNNHSGWGSVRYDALLHEANATADASRRMDLLHEAEVHAMSEVPLIPLYVYTRSEMWKPYLMGHWPNYQNHHPAKYWWIDARWYDGAQSSAVDNTPPTERY